MAGHRLFTLFVVLSLVVLGALVLRTALEASAVGRDIRQRLVQMNQSDNLGSGVPFVMYPQLVPEPTVKDTLPSAGILRR